MTNLDIIKQKVEDLKALKKELSTKEGVVNAMSPFYQKASNSLKEKIETNKELMLKTMSNSIAQKLDDNKESTDKVVDGLNALMETMDDETDKMMLETLKKMVSSLKKIEQKTTFDQNAFDKVFMDGINELTEIFLKESEEPTNTSYKRNSEGNITKVIESYNGYTLEYNWSYDMNGNLSNVKTIRKDDKTT